MAIDVNILDKTEMAYGVEVEVGYTCPHCGEYVTDVICFSKDTHGCIAEVEDHECPECGEESDLDVDMY